MLDQRAKVAATSSKHFAAKAKDRVDGNDADSAPPTDAPVWSVAKTWQKGKYILIPL